MSFESSFALTYERNANCSNIALDYRYHGPGPAQGTLNSSLGLEYDEYPLEIQCSSCFLQRFKLGFMSRWGETYKSVFNVGFYCASDSVEKLT